MVVKATTIKVRVLELKEIDSAQWSKGIKHELLSRADKAHKDAKAKKYGSFMKDAKAAKERIVKSEKGVRFHDKKGKGYIKGGKKKYD